MKDRNELTQLSKVLEQTFLLNQIDSFGEIVDFAVSSTKEIFNSSCSCLYIEKENGWILAREAGERRYHIIPPFLEGLEANTIQLEEKYIKAPIPNFGTIIVFGKEENATSYESFDEKDLDLLSLFLYHVGLKIEQLRKFYKLYNLANEDDLTGVYNRRYFQTNFNYLIRRSHHQEKFSLLLIDIDAFKKFNNEFGHDMGDEILRAIAKELKQVVRQMDIVGRVGGEDFAILLANTKDDMDEVISSTILSKINSLPFSRKVTVSIGISRFGIHGTTVEELFLSSKNALAKAKRNGGNQFSLPY